MNALRIGVILACLCTAVAGAEAPPPLKIGVGVSVITPFLDEPMAGYFYERFADGVHDDLYAKALLFDDGRTRAVLVACDLVRMPRAAAEDARARIQKRLGIPAANVMVSATHSHTGPNTTTEYGATLARRIADSVATAHGNAQPARLRFAIGSEPTLAHNRRYRMKDGSVVTNPGFLNPDVVQSVGQIDPRIPVLVAEDERGRPFVTWVNYAMHLDTVGGTWISSDYPLFLGRLLARVHAPELVTIFTIGAAGDINHWDVRRAGPQRGFDEARRIGQTLGGEVLKAWTELAPITAVNVRAVSAPLELPVPTVTEQEVAEMRRILAQPPPPKVDFALERVRAARIIAQGGMAGQPIATEVQVIAVGPIAFVGVPGELFVALGKQIQEGSPFPHTFIVELANDSIGYIPTKIAFEQGGYEPNAARMAPGGGELIVAKALELLHRAHR